MLLLYFIVRFIAPAIREVSRQRAGDCHQARRATPLRPHRRSYREPYRVF